MANGKTAKPKRRRRQAETVLIPFRVDELKSLVLERMSTPKNRGGRPKKV